MNKTISAICVFCEEDFESEVTGMLQCPHCGHYMSIEDTDVVVLED